MTGSSSWSEDAPGADILDLDRYMRGTRPARRPQRNISSSGLVVDAGAVGRPASPPGDSSSGSEASEPSEPSGPSGPSDKRFSHDSGLSDTSYRRASRQQRRHRADTVSKNDTEVPRRSNRSGGGAIRRGKSGEARRGNSGEARQAKSGEARRSNSGEARRGKSGEARRGKSGSEARRSSESRSSFRESLERALRDQQAQIARVAQMCELQARSGASERRSERRSERSERRKGRPSERERRTDKRNERGERRGQESGRTSSESTEFSSSSSSVDALKRRTSECRTYKIIMSKLDELNRLFVARRSPGAAGALAPGALGTASLAPGARGTARGDSSVTVSDKVVGTDSPQHGARQKTETDHNRTIIVAAAAVDIPPTPRINVVTESVVRDERDSKPASEKGMPGRFHLDDPVRLYQQAKRLEARVTRRSSSDSPDSGRDSSSKGSSQGSGKGSRSPSLCALCRCYWLVARRYVAQLNPVRE